jgi:hypothetical protein
MVGENFDSASEPPALSGPQFRAGRKFLGISFACCGVYSRIYINDDSTAYQGNCPKCSRRVEVLIAHDGKDTRFITAY